MYTVGLDAQWLFFTLFSQLSIYRVAKFSTKGKGSDLDRTKVILFGSLLGFFAFPNIIPVNRPGTSDLSSKSINSTAPFRGDVRRALRARCTKEIIFGSLLGVGKLDMPPRSINARFGFTQSEDHKDYFIFVCNSLSTLCSSKYRVYSYVDKRTGKTYKSLNF